MNKSRYKVVALAAITLCTVAIVAHSARLSNLMLATMRKYADQSGFNSLFEPLEGDLEAMMLGPDEFLGDTNEVDLLEDAPKTGADDPDTEEADTTLVDDDDDDVSQGGIAAAANGEGGEDGLAFAEPASLPEKEVPEVPSPAADLAPVAFRIYSHNIKNGDHKLTLGELGWDLRRTAVAASIRLYAVANTVVVLQEALEFQLHDVLQQLNLFLPADAPEWVSYGGGRIDGRTRGEYVPILVRRSEWEAVHDDTMWLNNKETRKAVVGWDAKYPRIATWAVLRHRATGAHINVFNTHFDHKGKTARIESAKLIMESMSVNEWPLFLTGDLNAVPDDASYKQLAKNLKDSHKLAAAYNRYGHPDYSVTGFSGRYLRDAKRIDYVFAPHYTRRLSELVCEADGDFYLQLQGYGLMHSKYGGLYMSDHRPVVVDFVLGGCDAVRKARVAQKEAPKAKPKKAKAKAAAKEEAKEEATEESKEEPKEEPKVEAEEPPKEVQEETPEAK